MEKAKLKYIEEQCNQMLTGLYRLRHIDEDKGRFQLCSVIMVKSGIELIAAALKRDRKSTRLNSSHIPLSRMPSSA